MSISTVNKIKNCGITFAALITAVSVLLTGCEQQQSQPLQLTASAPHLKYNTQSTDIKTLMPIARTYIAGFSVKGRPIPYTVIGDGPEKILIIATIHGNEPAGTPLANKLKQNLKNSPSCLENRTIIIIPNANPDGYADNTRHNYRGIDLNRNFPTSNRINNNTNGVEPLCEPESRAIKKVIEKYNPSRVLSIHQPLTCIDYDGPAGLIAERMANHCDLPVRKLGARPGSLGSFLGKDLRTPIITLELPPSASKLNSEQLWQKYGNSITAFINYPQNI